jgi:hypothetical protein
VDSICRCSCVSTHGTSVDIFLGIRATCDICDSANCYVVKEIGSIGGRIMLQIMGSIVCLILWSVFWFCIHPLVGFLFTAIPIVAVIYNWKDL